MAACQWGDEIESLVQPNPDDFLVLFSDTSTVTLSTVQYDSLMTGSSERILVGRFDDPYFGRMQTSFSIQPTIESSVSVPDEAVYDSLVLYLPYFRDANTKKPYSYGDTTKRMNLSVYALTDILKLPAYYNLTSTPHDTTPLGVRSFLPRPFSESTLQIRLTDILGRKIFEQAKANLLTSNDQWVEILKGLLVEAKSTDNGAVVGFQSYSDSTAIQLHYHTTGTDGITSGSVRIKNMAAYNRILGDRSKTALTGLLPRRLTLPSSASGEKAFIQDGTGIMMRIDIPYVRTLKDTKYSVSNRAFLRVTPMRQSVTRNFTAPPMLHAYLCDKNNEFLAQLTDLQNKAVVGLYTVDLVNNTEYYSFDVSAYVTNLLNSDREVNNGIILMSSAINPSSQYPELNTDLVKGLNRLVVGSQRNTTDRGIKLELYYTTVKPSTK